MSPKTTEGIVLHKYELRETSYILVVYTPDLGKVRGVIKGVRKPYPQFAGNFDIFTRCEFSFYEKKRSALDLITRCECLDYYLKARKDIERLTYANYIIELIDVVTSDKDPNEDLYATLRGSLELLAGDSSAKRVGRIFEVKLLDAIGLTPELNRCVVCGCDKGREVVFSVPEGGVVCPDCLHEVPGKRRVSRGTVNFLKKVQQLPLKNTERIKVSRQVGQEAEALLKTFLDYHIGRPLKSRGFLEQIKTLGSGKAVRIK